MATEAAKSAGCRTFDADNVKCDLDDKGQCRLAPESVQRLRTHPEAGLRALMLWPDRTCAERPELSFRQLWEGLREQHARERLEETALRFVEGLCAYRSGLSEDAIESFQAAVKAAGSISSVQARGTMMCAAKWSLALALRRSGRMEAAVDTARESAHAGRQAGSVWLEGEARLALGRVLRYMPGERERARANFDQAHRLLSAAHPPDPLGLAYVRAHEARLALDAGNAFLSLSLLRDARSGFGRCRHHRALAHSQIDQGWAHLQLRSIGVARESGEEALGRFEAMGDKRGILRVHQLLAQTFLEEGRAAEAAARFEELERGAVAIRDTTIHSEALVGQAMAHFQEGNSRAVARALREAEELLKQLPPWIAALEWQAISIAQLVRSRQFSEVPSRLRRLRGVLRRYNMPRTSAECLALCGFELAREGRLRDAAPVLKEALSAASQPDAVAWTERFLSTVSAVDVRQWIASLVTEMNEHAHLAEQYQALRICAVAGLHDVKNLSTAVYAAIEMAIMEMDGAPAPLMSAKDNAFRAGVLASDVEEQIVSGKTGIVLSPQPVGLDRLLQSQRIAIEHTPTLGNCILRVEEGLPAVLCDERYIARVFGNLKSNAEKYAAGCDVVLSARAHTVGKRREVVIGFADNGQGIDPEDAEILFNAFKNPGDYRQRRPNHGSGFGLHYCKLVVEAHGGRIWVDPRPGEGAAFYFTLPAA